MNQLSINRKIGWSSVFELPWWLMVETFFDEPGGNGVKIYENIEKIVGGQGDDYDTSCLLDYSYSKENYKLITVDLRKQQAFDFDLKAI